MKNCFVRNKRLATQGRESLRNMIFLIAIFKRDCYESTLRQCGNSIFSEDHALEVTLAHNLVNKHVIANIMAS